MSAQEQQNEKPNLEAMTKAELIAYARRLENRLEEVQNVCGEAYQMAGCYDAPEKVLDNLNAAASGLDIPHESFLPFDPPNSPKTGVKQ